MKEFWVWPVTDEVKLAEFMKNVDKSRSGCWLWRREYEVKEDDQPQELFRKSMILHGHPQVPEEGWDGSDRGWAGYRVRHTCAKRPCVNPGHLVAMKLPTAEEAQRNRELFWQYRRSDKQIANQFAYLRRKAMHHPAPRQGAAREAQLQQRLDRAFLADPQLRLSK